MLAVFYGHMHGFMDAVDPKAKSTLSFNNDAPPVHVVVLTSTVTSFFGFKKSLSSSIQIYVICI